MKEHIQGLHHIGIPTSQMDETVSFYQAFGAKTLYEKMDEHEGRPIRVTLMELAGVVIEFYERSATVKAVGAIDHIAFNVHNVEEMYRVCKEKGYRLMEECAAQIGVSTYWPNDAQWFIVYGPNEEKIEFCHESKA